MARYQITFRCGHTGEVEIYGKVSERESKSKWYEGQLCRECYKRQQEEARKAESVDAAQRNADCGYGLPAISGTPKQVAWAETIRSKLVDYCVSHKLKFEQAESNPKIAAIVSVMRNPSASWWIDHRSESPETIIRNAVK